MKSLLSRPGRGGQWRSWLRERGIPRSTADRLVARHAETLDIDNERNVPSGASSGQAETAAEKVARNVWHRFGKLLPTDESVILFIGQIAELAGVGHEQRAEGLVIFMPAAKAAEELPGSAPASGPVQQSSGETPPVMEEPKGDTAVTPTEIGLAVAAAETGNGVAA